VWRGRKKKPLCVDVQVHCSNFLEFDEEKRTKQSAPQ
jgi:hypothetical protein